MATKWKMFAITAAASTLVSSSAFAYRPFDGTDADTAGLHEFELELGPVGYSKEGNNHLLVVPRFTLNYGMAENVELVVDGRAALALDQNPDGSRARYDDSDVFLKTVFRKGVLQGGSGPSIAVEVGPLLPSIGAAQGFGVSCAMITSFRNDYGTLHLNTVGLIDRDTHDRELFAGFILEGPFTWRLRPVTELYYDRDFGGATTFSALGGAIFRVNDGFAIDAGLRAASVDGNFDGEVRAGITWSFEVY